MKKNGAIWVALVVLAAAALLMYFVVLPQVRGSKTMDDLAKKAGQTVEQAKNTAQKTVEQTADTAQKTAEQAKETAAKTVDQAKNAAQQTLDQAKDTAQKTADQVNDAVQQVAADPKAGILQKMARIKASGEEATVEFEELFADNKRPTVEQIEAARAKLEAALKSASEMKATEGLDPQTLDMIDNTSKGAERALVALEAMPKDVAGAKAAYDALKLTMMAALSGEEEPKTSVEPAKEIATIEDVKPADSNDAAAKPADTADTKPAVDDPNLPSFDVLRVEKDGSTVIAGHALPRSKVEVFDGDKVIATTDAGDEGDFVVVLDNPLPAGDHEIVLQATDRKGVKFRSLEIATVSIPADKAGEVLAMVTKPGEASRIMEMPEADKTEQVVADNSDQTAKNAAVEAKPEIVQPDKQAKVEAKAEQPTDAKTEAKAEVKVGQKTDVQPAEVAKTNEAKPEDKAIVTPELPDASDDLANSAPDIKQDENKAAETAVADQAKSADKAEPQQTEVASEAAKPADDAKAADAAKSEAVTADATSKDTAQTAESETTVADASSKDAEAKNETADAAKTVADNATPVSADAKPAAKSLTKPEVLVNAVEIEGNKIFVAGSARPKAVVRVYADDKLVAEISTDDNGRFVADNSLPLSVGNHTIRADVLSNDGKRVEFRASVPFFRPEGEQLAAVNDGNETADDKTMQSLADDDYNKAREDAGKAVSLLKGLYQAGRTPTLDELAAARSATEIALKTLSQIKLSDSDNPATKQMADKTAGEAAKALALLKSLPQDANAVKTALDSIDDAVTSAVAPAVKTEASNKTTATEKETAAADTTVSKAKSSDSTQIADDAAKADDTAKTAEQQAADDKASSTSDQPVSTENKVASADASETKVIEQAPLKASQSASVIIRRGDTLWQISRRVYGRGVRYTTIYLANEDQISNPDRIMPGQIFGVPDKYLPNSEELHRERMEHKKQ